MLDLARQFGAAFDVAEAEGDVGAGMGKRPGDGFTEAAGGAGDECDFAAEIETGQVGHDGILWLIYQIIL